MDTRKNAFLKRIEQNSKNYSPKDLFDIGVSEDMLKQLYNCFKLETLMTDRHGNIIMTIGDFEGFVPDVVNHPGNKIRVKGRTVCHIYAKYDKVSDENKEITENILLAYIKTLEGYSEKSYLVGEQTTYIDELEQQLEKDVYHAKKYTEQSDPLTGLLKRNYFLSSMKQLTRSEVVPAAAICVNINDWRFFDNNYGEEESDRLIVTVANILKEKVEECGFENAVMGRVEGDVFNVVLPLVEEYEAKEYCEKIQQACLEFEDDILAPSIAVGCVMKTNVEETYKDVFSDAEYVMLENKFEIKKSEGYIERREKGLKK